MTHLDGEALSALIDDEGSPEERAHFVGCAQCRRAAEGLRDVARAGSIPPPPRQAAEVDAAVGAAMAAWDSLRSQPPSGPADELAERRAPPVGARGRAVRPEGSERRSAGPGVGSRRSAGRAVGSRRWAGPAVVAAVLVVAVAGVVALASRPTSTSSSTASASKAAPSAAPAPTPVTSPSAQYGPSATATLGSIDGLSQLATAVRTHLEAVSTGAASRSGLPSTTAGALAPKSAAAPATTSGAVGPSPSNPPVQAACQPEASVAGAAAGGGAVVEGPAVEVAPLVWRGAPAEAWVVPAKGVLAGRGSVVVVVDPVGCRVLATTRL